MMKYDQSLRARGGINWGDAMFRANVDPQRYSKTIGEKIINKKGLSDYFEFINSDSFFIISFNSKPMIIKDYDFVELKRREGLHSYEEWLENMLDGLVE